MPDNNSSQRSMEDLLNNRAHDDPSKAYTQTLSTRVDKVTFDALSRLASDWGLSQSEALRRIVVSFTMPERFRLAMEKLDKNELPNVEVPGEPDGFGHSLYPEFHKFSLFGGTLNKFRYRLTKSLAELDMRDARMQSALDALKDYLKNNPVTPYEGGDETTEKP